MGVSSTTNTEMYNGDGSTVAFAFPFYFFRQADLFVYKFDTLLGGITQMTFGAGITLTGTPNAQGLYVNGGGVTFSVAPLVTDVVVISRFPVETNTYALLQNGSISSNALVQQLDYLTLLCQSLQDQVNRCAQLPAGFGGTFNPALPSALALAVNETATLIINSSGNGWAIGPSAATIVTNVAAAAASATAAAASASSASTSATASAASATTASTAATTAAASATAAATSATNAATSATAAAASATAAAASAAAASAASGLKIFGTRASPILVATSGVIAFTAATARQKQYIKGNGGAVTSVTLQNGTVDGQEAIIQGTDNTNTVSLTTNLGQCILGSDQILTLNWDTNGWKEVSRSN
jgi:hypothetical protein